MNTLDDEDIDIEMTPEILANVSGGRIRKVRYTGETDEKWKYN